MYVRIAVVRGKRNPQKDDSKSLSGKSLTLTEYLSFKSIEHPLTLLAIIASQFMKIFEYQACATEQRSRTFMTHEWKKYYVVVEIEDPLRELRENMHPSAKHASVIEYWRE